MILYHGSYLDIKSPNLEHSRKNGIISRYEFDEKASQKLKILKFDSYSEEWLDFILTCSFVSEHKKRWKLLCAMKGVSTFDG